MNIIIKPHGYLNCAALSFTVENTIFRIGLNNN